MPNNKLHAIVGRAPKVPMKPDDFWPLPDTFMGVEFEIEGVKRANLDMQELCKLWKEVEDHSLRGGTEFIFANPYYGSALTAAIKSFFKGAKNYTTSSRTSTHIHINMMGEDDDVSVLKNTLLLYCAAEDCFFNEAGEDRRWSGYCWPMADAPIGITSAMMEVPFNEALLNQQIKKQRANGDRYYALNLLSLGKHGTLEFRHFPCATDEAQVTKWVKMVMHLKKAALAMSADNVDALQLLSDMSTAERTLRKYLEISDEVLRFCPVEKIVSKIAGIASNAENNSLLKDRPSESYKFNEDSNALFSLWIKRKGLKPPSKKALRTFPDNVGEYRFDHPYRQALRKWLWEERGDTEVSQFIFTEDVVSIAEKNGVSRLQALRVLELNHDLDIARIARQVGVKIDIADQQRSMVHKLRKIKEEDGEAGLRLHAAYEPGGDGAADINMGAAAVAINPWAPAPEVRIRRNADGQQYFYLDDVEVQPQPPEPPRPDDLDRNHQEDEF